MELKHLRSFIVVADELHFGRAAQRLFIVQPALSKQIAALEEDLGVQLFERSKRHVALTPAGESLRRDAEEVLQHTESTIRRARIAASGETGELRIGCPPPLLFRHLPTTLASYRSRSPMTRVFVSETNTHDGMEKVASRQLDVAYVRLPTVVKQELECRRVLAGPMLVALPEDDPLATQAEIDLGDLRQAALILLSREREPELHDFQLALCAAADFKPTVSHEVDGTVVALALVASGIGFCFVPWTATSLPYPGVTYRPLRAPVPQLSFGMVWRAEGVTPPLGQFLSLHAEVQQEMDERI